MAGNDLERILSTAAHLGVPALVCINKYDLNLEMSRIIAEDCAARGIPLVGHISFDVAVTKAMVQGQPVITYSQGLVSQEIKRLWRETERFLDG